MTSDHRYFSASMMASSLNPHSFSLLNILMLISRRQQGVVAEMGRDLEVGEDGVLDDVVEVLGVVHAAGDEATFAIWQRCLHLRPRRLFRRRRIYIERQFKPEG